MRRRTMARPPHPRGSARERSTRRHRTRPPLLCKPLDTFILSTSFSRLTTHRPLDASSARPARSSVTELSLRAPGVPAITAHASISKGRSQAAASASPLSSRQRSIVSMHFFKPLVVVWKSTLQRTSLLLHTPPSPLRPAMANHPLMSKVYARRRMHRPQRGRPSSARAPLCCRAAMAT